MMEVSRGCAESGWVLALTAGHPAAFLSGFAEEGQKEVHGAFGDARVPAAAIPGGAAVPSEDGYLVNGAWDYSSGCESKKSPLPPFQPRVDSEEFQRHFGEAQGLIDTAEAALLHLGASFLEFGRRYMEGGQLTARHAGRGG